MKYEYMSIVEMNGTKYNAIFLSGLYGNTRTVDTLEKAKKCLQSYVDYLTNGKAKVDYSLGIGVKIEGSSQKIDKTYIKKRQVTDWEIME